MMRFTLCSLGATLALAACAGPQGTITHSDDATSPASAARTGGGERAALPAPARTVDAIPIDDTRRAFEQLPATLGANKRLAAAPRPTATAAVTAVPMARASAGTDDAEATTVAAEAPAPPETLPSPSFPTRRATEESPTPATSEGAILRGGTADGAPGHPTPAPTAPATPEPIAPPAEPVAPPAEPTAPPAEPVTPPTEPAAPPAEPAAPPAEPPAPPIEPAAPPAAPPVEPVPQPNPAAATVPTLLHPALATRVRGFGDLSPLAPAVLTPGARVVVYFELAGWQSPPRDDGQFVTEATYAIQVLDAEGRPVWSDAPQRAKDVSRTVRTDLFVTRLVNLPATLAVGKYAMRIVANDTANGLQSVATVPFEIIAEPAK